MLKKDIVSDRLILKSVRLEHAESVYNIWKGEENEKYMGDPVSSIDEVRAICIKHGKRRDEEQNLTVVVEKESGDIIGTICFGNTDRDTQWGFGYNIRKESWGRGYATEMVKSVIEYGKSRGIKSFISDCAEENTGSERVMIKCGMEFVREDSFTQPKLGIEYKSKVYELNIK